MTAAIADWANSPEIAAQLDLLIGALATGMILGALAVCLLQRWRG